jgi:hypothetical protein
MANNFKQANAAVNSGADAVCALLNGGKLRIYDGTQPATADTAITDQVLLAELTFGNPAFGAATAGVAAAEAITKDSSADHSGNASWFRALKSDNTPVYDGSVGVSGCDLNLNRIDIQSGGEVSVTSLTYTHPKS